MKRKIIITETDRGIDIEGETDFMEIHRLLHAALRELKTKHMKAKKERQ